MEKVLVLMSTFNGEKYLEEQIESILNQQEVEVDILVRDDGSSDKTKEILNNYQKQGKLTWYTGENLKSAGSFLNLIYNCNDGYKYYALSDQDDFWKEKKIINAINKLEENEQDKELMYFCDKEIVDENLNIIENKEVKYVNNFKCAMVRNIATGCTIVFNNKLLKTLKDYKIENIYCMHDSWIYRVCLAVDGVAIYDNRKNIMYRQHSNNVLGAKEDVIKMLRRRMDSFFHCKHLRRNCAIELLNGYEKRISSDKKEYLNCFVNYQKSIKSKYKLLKYNNKTEDSKMNKIFKICVLINRI